MLRKEALLKQLELLAALVKKASPLLNKHITSSLSFSDLTEDERDKIVERFQDISVTQAKHIEILDQIRSEIVKGKKMFTKDDYANYFTEIEGIFKNNLEIYTDLLNELTDQAIRNKLFMLAEEDMNTFNFIAETKRKYFEKR